LWGVDHPVPLCNGRHASNSSYIPRLASPPARGVGSQRSVQGMVQFGSVSADLSAADLSQRDRRYFTITREVRTRGPIEAR